MRVLSNLLFVSQSKGIYSMPDQSQELYEYFGIDLQIIWSVIGEELPILLSGVQQILTDMFSVD